MHHGVNIHLALAFSLNSVLNVKAVVATFSQEMDLAGAFSVIANLGMDFVSSSTGGISL